MDRWLSAGVNRRHCIAAALAGAYAARAGAQAPRAPATVLVLGDSLSAEYGLRRGTGWVALLEKKLAAEKIAARVVNASISGDTTSGGRSRLAPLLAQHKPTHVIVELGANDALRGLPLAMTEDNLSAMTVAAQNAGARVLLAGIALPPNYGADFGEKFIALYERVGRKHRAAVLPFILKGVADGPDTLRYFQPDRIHPTEEAQPIMLANVWAVLRPLL